MVKLFIKNRKEQKVYVLVEGEGNKKGHVFREAEHLKAMKEIIGQWIKKI